MQGGSKYSREPAGRTDCEVSAGWQRINSREIPSVQSWIPATYQKSGFFRQDSGAEGDKGKENAGDISEE